jgi:3-methyl-2-oxobutanoate hydroxymethyltransferase
MEGGEDIADEVEALIRAGVPVMGHLGLTPQSINQIGGYRIQGKLEQEAAQMLRDAKALEAAGAFAIVLELVTEPIAEAISKELSIPTIGIGAGRGCDGQVLVFHDILQYSSPYREKRFVKTYADIGTTIRNAIGAYVSDVKSGAFPEEKHTFQLEPGTIVIPNLYGSGTTQEVEATEQERKQTT